MKFIPGRIDTGYFKLKLIEWKFFDFYILKYPTNSFIPYHFDKVEGKRHYRINIRLPFGRGGNLKMIDTGTCRAVSFFRPDLVRHKVTKVKRGTVYALSLGFTRKDKTWIQQ